MIINLAKRVAIVSGAGSGIGRSVATTLAKAGAGVACFDINGEAANETKKIILENYPEANVVAHEVDITDKTSFIEAVDLAKIDLPGDLSIGVNCAGITKDGFLVNMQDNEFHNVIDVNLKGTYVFTQTLARMIIARRELEHQSLGGSIINISSIVGKTGNLGQTNYAASKAGVIGFSKAAARELAKHKIRVNSVLPGFIETPMVDTVPDKVKEEVLRPQIPLKEFGTPQNIADACVFLASDQASYITGAQLEVTGGFCM